MCEVQPSFDDSKCVKFNMSLSIPGTYLTQLNIAAMVISFIIAIHDLTMAIYHCKSTNYMLSEPINGITRIRLLSIVASIISLTFYIILILFASSSPEYVLAACKVRN